MKNKELKLAKARVKTIRKNSGVTLIALVVTIIVMLILAGATMATLTGNNGMISNARKSANKSEEAKKEEKRKMAQGEAAMNMSETEYNGVTIPEGFAPTKIEGEDTIEKGLVITDGKGNEYVWIEVPRTQEVYGSCPLDITNFSEAEYESIETALRNYTRSAYVNDESFNTHRDCYTNATEVDLFENGKDDYNNLKYKMLKSLYKNQGFWIGRYLAGKDVVGKTTETPQSKKDLYPYVNITVSQAQRLAEKVSNGDYTSSLMFGIQYNLVAKFLERKQQSIGKGNYANCEIKMNRGKYLKFSNWQVNENEGWKDYTENTDIVVNGNKKVCDAGYGCFFTTGASDECQVLNIYDFLGNVKIFTLEQVWWWQKPTIIRGANAGAKPWQSNIMDIYLSRETVSRGDLAYFAGFRVTLF